MHSLYLHCLRRKAMVKQQQHAQARQLDLLVLASKETRYQRLDAVTRAEVTGLLKLLLDAPAPLPISPS
jgi:hypothetical protein